MYASSRSCDFSMQNVSVSTYLDITYPRLLLWIDFLAHDLQLIPASTYIFPPTSQFTLVSNVLAQHFDAVGILPCVEIGLLIAYCCKYWPRHIPPT